MELYKTIGTCCKQIIFKVEDDKLSECKFICGCNGNLQALSRLLIGRPVDEIIERLRDIKCRNNTSCPAQLSQALYSFKNRGKEPVEAEN